MFVGESYLAFFMMFYDSGCINITNIISGTPDQDRAVSWLQYLDSPFVSWGLMETRRKNMLGLNSQASSDKLLVLEAYINNFPVFFQSVPPSPQPPRQRGMSLWWFTSISFYWCPLWYLHRSSILLPLWQPLGTAGQLCRTCRAGGGSARCQTRGSSRMPVLGSHKSCRWPRWTLRLRAHWKLIRPLFSLTGPFQWQVKGSTNAQNRYILVEKLMAFNRMFDNCLGLSVDPLYW